MTTPETPTDKPDRPASKPVPLYLRMYFHSEFIDLVRLVGYEGLPLPEGQEDLQKLIDKYGQDKMRAAAEEITFLDETTKLPIAKLTEQARKLAFQLLGPPPENRPKQRASTQTATRSTPASADADPALTRLNKRQLRCRLRDARRRLEHNGKRSFVGKLAKKDIAAVEAEMHCRGMDGLAPGRETQKTPATQKPRPPREKPEGAEAPASQPAAASTSVEPVMSADEEFDAVVEAPQDAFQDEFAGLTLEPVALPDEHETPHASATEVPPSAANAAASVMTPLMRQYREVKERHPGMLLLFRMGDFYELFSEDAETAAKLLGLTLTTRDRTVSMAGFPHHALETHLRKLLQAGQRVAICEQVDTDAGAAGQAGRDVTRVVSPGSPSKPSRRAHDRP